MKKFTLLFLFTSLAANAWLLLRPATAVTEVTAPIPAPRAAAEEDSTPAAATLHTLAKIDRMDLATLRDELRAQGVDETIIRGLVEGALRCRFHDETIKWRMERWRTAWWRGANAAGGPPAPSLRNLVREPLRALLGPDPLDLLEAEARYDFLPKEKARLMALMDLDYSELKSRSNRGVSAGATQAELQEQRLLALERQKDVLAALTPEERAEYDLRFSTAAARNSRRYSAIGITEQEYRAAAPIFSELQQAMEASTRNASSADATAQSQRAIDQLVAALGYDRALDFIWGLDSEPYSSLSKKMRDLRLPTANAARLLQLSSATGMEATAIHYDDSLSADQKRAALAALQQRVRPQLDALVPPAAQAGLGEPLAWFTVLGEGRYMQRSPVLVGASYMVASAMAVTTKPTGHPRTIPLARPPAP